MAAFLDACRFIPAAGGTTDWTFVSAVGGYQSPAAAGVVNSRLYKYRAESTDLTQWEIGEGAYNTSTGVLARTTVLFNSSGTTSKVSFTAVPQIAIVALKEDLISVEEANGFTAGQKKQARANIGVPVVGNCYLSLSAGNLMLSRQDGMHLFVNGALEEIPSSGVSLSPTGVTLTNGVSSSRMQYIYAFMNSGTMTLEFSSTAYAQDATYGHQTKSGDGTRTLVGIWAAAGTNAWSTVATDGASYFNPRLKSAQTSPQTVSTTATSLAFVPGSSSQNFVTFANRAVELSVQANLSCTVATADMVMNLGLDLSATNALVSTMDDRVSTTSAFDFAYMANTKTFVEGWHQLTPIGNTSSGTLNFVGLTTEVCIWG